jgi:carbon monoxide dehydrogenase subunit G
MEMQGTRQLTVTQQQAWDALNNPDILKACIAGCDRIEATGENQYAVGVALKIGPVSAKFAGKIALTEINAPHSYTLGFDGQGGAAGFGKGVSKVALTPNGQGCELAYSVTAQVGGKIAQVGQRLIDGVARSMAEDFFKRFDGEMQRLYPMDPAPATNSVANNSDSESASKAKGFKIPAWGWAVIGAGLLALFVYLL